MSFLKDLANCAATVPVAGEPIVLRFPLDVDKFAALRMLRDVPKLEQGGKDEDENIEIARQVNRLCAHCLKSTVASHDDMSAEDWSRLITMSNDEPDKHEGLIDLVMKACELCGIKGLVQKKDGTVAGRDHVSEVEESLDERPTS